MLHITTFVFSLSSPSKWNHAVCVGCSRAREFHQHVAKRDDKLWFSCSHHRNLKSSLLLRTTFLRLLTGASSHLPPVRGSRLDILRTGCCGIRNSLFPRLEGEREGVREEERESPLPRAHLPGNIWTVSPLQHWAEQPSNLFSAIGQRKKGKRKKNIRSSVRNSTSTSTDSWRRRGEADVKLVFCGVNTSCQYCKAGQSFTYKKQYFIQRVDAHIDLQVGSWHWGKTEATLYLSGRKRPEFKQKCNQRFHNGKNSLGLASDYLQRRLKVKLKWPLTREKRSSAKYNQAQIISHYGFPPISIFLNIFNWVKYIHQMQLFAGKLLENKANAWQ